MANFSSEKVEKQKMLKMLSFIICEAPQKLSTIFKPFLAIFTLFHWKNWPYLQKPEFGNLAKTRFRYLLVNNSLCSIPLSYARSYIKEIPGDRCAEDRMTDVRKCRRRNCSTIHGQMANVQYFQ